MAVRHGPTPKMSIDNRVNRSIVNMRSGATKWGGRGELVQPQSRLVQSGYLYKILRTMEILVRPIEVEGGYLVSPAIVSIGLGRKFKTVEKAQFFSFPVAALISPSSSSVPQSRVPVRGSIQVLGSIQVPGSIQVLGSIRAPLQVLLQGPLRSGSGERLTAAGRCTPFIVGQRSNADILVTPILG